MCCKVLSGGECAAAVLGIAQIGGQWTCFMFMYVIFRPNRQEVQEREGADISPQCVPLRDLLSSRSRPLFLHGFNYANTATEAS